MRNVGPFALECLGQGRSWPLTLSGRGALLPEEVEGFANGYACFPGTDAQGHSICIYAPERAKQFSTSMRHRVSFFLRSYLCENDMSMTDGYVVIVLVGDQGGNADMTTQECIEIATSQGGHGYFTHIVNPPMGIGTRNFYEVLYPIVQRIFRTLTNDKIAVHLGDKSEMVYKLGCHGLAPYCIPESIGGTWTLAKHMEWLSNRQQQDLRLYGAQYALPARSPATSLAAPAAANVERPVVIATPLKEPAGTSWCRDDAVIKVALAMETMSVEEKADYVEAVTKAPDITERECDPVAFLRAQNRNAAKAASQMATYWKVRKKVFGSSAFTALNQTGKGALDRRDLATLGSTFLMSLPNDAAGRSVIFCDGCRLTRCGRENQLRTTFYLYSIAAENRASQTEGAVLIYVATEPSFDRANQECMDLVMSALPIRLRDIHVICNPINDADQTDYTDKLDSSTISRFKQVSMNEVAVHVTGTRSSVAEHQVRHVTRRSSTKVHRWHVRL